MSASDRVLTLNSWVLGLLVVFAAFNLACSDSVDAESDDEPVETTYQELCADPDGMDGLTVEVSAQGLEAVKSISGGGDCDCCGAVWVDYVFSCSEEYGDGVVLTAADGAELEEVEATNMTGTYKTTMGCVGEECSEVCAPAPVDELESIVGIFRKEEGTAPHSDGGTYDFHLEVESVILVE